MTNKSNSMWGGRFASGVDALMEAINVSTSFDYRMAKQDIMGSVAHVDMLSKTGIITQEDASKIKVGLEELGKELSEGKFIFDPSLEDIHMNVESKLTDRIGKVAGKLHTARSRNDQVATDFKLWVREYCDLAIEALQALQQALIKQAEAGLEIWMPGFTHLQVAQPVTWAQHMMAYVNMFGRDIDRFQAARTRMNESPLGAAALAGTSFPIDRHMTAKALGFDRPMENSMDAVADRDFALDYLAAASIAATHLSRLAEELVIWSSAQFQFVRLPDGFSTGSSIMPQKRNPDAAELVRAKVGRINGSLIALLTVLKGLPLSYSKDMQEDKEQVFDAADNLGVAILAMTGMVSQMEPNVEKLNIAASHGYSTATDLADWLVRVYGIPFRECHHITGTVVKLAEDKGVELHELELADFQSVYPEITEDIYNVLTVENSVRSRTSFGGTAPSEVKRQIQHWKGKLT